MRKIHKAEIKEVFTIRLPIDLADKIVQMAEEEDRSVNYIVNKLVREVFKGNN